MKRLARMLTDVSATMALMAAAQTGVQVKGIVTLAGLRDRSRPLVVFAPRPDDNQLQMQLRTLQQNASGVAERDIVVIALPITIQRLRPSQ